MGNAVDLEGANEALLTGESLPLTGSEFDDSFLREVAEQPTLVPMPVLGERLGGLEGSRYEILGLVGRGGMGQVFRALDHELQRTVALKFLLSFLRLAPEQMAELIREEAQATARLEHDNIVRIYDVSLWNTGIRSSRGVPTTRIPFLVMEYLPGESLQVLLQRERLDLRRILEIVVDVSAGLAHAHERQLVHLDLKPGNVFVLATHRVKLLDFGLSRLLIGTRTEVDSSGSGTPPYMSPQRWRRTPPQAHDDIWSCGILLYELLTGELPFPRLSPHELRAQTLSAAPMPSVRKRRPELPEEVDQLVAATLDKEPDKRPADGSELLKQLCALQERLALRPQRPRVNAERRQVTLVACRLQLAPGTGEIDPEDFSELEAAFHRACTHIIHQQGGVITTAVGIEVLACFGYPRVQEEDADHAVRAALRQFQELPGQLLCLWRHGLSVKVGIHTDMVALADVMPEFHGVAPAMQGEGPRIASWLATQAERDTVLLSDQTHALVRGRFQTRPLGQWIFEGLLGSRSIGVHQVLHELRNVTRFDRALVMGPLTPLVGRERELRRLTLLQDEATHEHGAVVLLRGEAGIGKSRLVQELHDQEPPGASTWARCQCWSQYKNSAFYPLIDWLQRILELAPVDTPRQKLRTLEERLSAYGMDPEYVAPLAALLSLPLPEGSSFPLLPPERQRERGVQALSELLQRLSQKRPLVFVVEDVHWADPSTLQFLGFLLANIERIRICVLLTTRPELTHDWAGHPGFHELRLQPLSPEATTRLVQETAQGRTLPAGTVEQLVAKSDGIPFFIEEMTRMMLEQQGPAGPVREGGIPPIPATLQELLLARLDQLQPRAKALAQLAALLGREFNHDVLRAVSFLGEDELKQDIERLEQAGLLFQQGWPPQLTYAFKHALVQDTAYQSLPRSTRQHFHTRIFHVLSERFPAMMEEQPEVLAHHASRAGLAAQAAELWQRAGQRAGAKSACSEAVTHFTRALEQLALLPASRERDEREIALSVELGQILISTKGYAASEVEEAYSRARALCERYGDVPSSVLWGIWVVALVRGEREDTGRIAALYQGLIESSDDPTTGVVSHAALAAWNFWRGAYTEALRHCAQAREVLDRERALGDVAHIRGGGIQSYVSEQILYVQLTEAFGESMRGNMVRAREAYQRALAMAEAHPYAVAVVLSFCASIEYEAGEPEAARDLSNRLISISAGNGFLFTLALGHCVHGWATAELGDAAAGIATIRQGLGLLRAMGAMVVYPTCLGCLLKAQLLAGQLAEGLAAVEEGLGLLETLMARRSRTELLRLRGEFLLRQGETEAARASLEQARQEAHDSGATLHELRAVSSLARLMRQSGETQEARVLLSEVCDRFTEGLDLRDHKAARELLAELSSEPEHSPGSPPPA
ncbi:protein kinase [Vitiosangium sp. GDMCC 1.1324]|uniref:protein kinase domain-containing protein n=1 Tax=Vitiosangium sp. (strain GDMCC 1.1324) TaxID=2138576 RepID=UPI000D3C7DBF|nr:protein kinase [Vitiosangium sp. GDMCC 1.1324]PTL78755.1 protein kinase [Vitiosangium sp. GDMCC 1.1324]